MIITNFKRSKTPNSLRRQAKQTYYEKLGDMLYNP